MTLTITKEKLLFVEGLTDQGFFEELLKHKGIHDVQVIQLRSKDKFKEQIPLLLSQYNRKKIRKLALIRDADESKNAAFESCKNLILKLRDKRFSISINKKTKMSKNFFPGNPSVGIHILSEQNKDSGMLEDLLWKVVPSPVKKCIKDYLTCVHLDKSIYKNYSKNKIYAFLAAQNEGLGSISVAAQKGIWKFESENIFDDLKHFLEDFRD